MNNAKQIPPDRWFAMTRLDENRAKAQLAHKAGVEVTAVTNMTIWGNHSATQYPDFYNAKINGRAANEVIGDEEVAEGDIYSNSATTRRRDYQSARPLVGGVGRERGGRHGAFIDNRYAEGGLAQRRIVFHWRIWS